MPLFQLISIWALFPCRRKPVSFTLFCAQLVATRKKCLMDFIVFWFSLPPKPPIDHRFSQGQSMPCRSAAWLPTCIIISSHSSMCITVTEHTCVPCQGTKSHIKTRVRARSLHPLGPLPFMQALNEYGNCKFDLSLKLLSGMQWSLPICHCRCHCYCHL